MQTVHLSNLPGGLEAANGRLVEATENGEEHVEVLQRPQLLHNQNGHELPKEWAKGDVDERGRTYVADSDEGGDRIASVGRCVIPEDLAQHPVANLRCTGSEQRIARVKRVGDGTSLNERTIFWNVGESSGFMKRLWMSSRLLMARKSSLSRRVNSCRTTLTNETRSTLH